MFVMICHSTKADKLSYEFVNEIILNMGLRVLIFTLRLYSFRWRVVEISCDCSYWLKSLELHGS